MLRQGDSLNLDDVRLRDKRLQDRDVGPDADVLAQEIGNAAGLWGDHPDCLSQVAPQAAINSGASPNASAPGAAYMYSRVPGTAARSRVSCIWKTMPLPWLKTISAQVR